MANKNILYQKSKRIKYILFLLFILSVYSCTEEITIHTDNSEPVIVIYGALTDEIKHQSITIGKSSPYFDNQSNPVISGAIVTITDSNNKVYELIEDGDVLGLYATATEWAVKEGFTYSLRVEVDFDSDGVKDIYEASTTILPTIEIDSISIVPIRIMGHANYAVNLYGVETPGQDFYLCKYTVNDSLVREKISEYQVLDDKLFNNQYIDGITLTFFDDITEWETDSEENRKRSVYLRSGDKVGLQMSRIPEGYFNFINQCRRGMNGSNPFFGGPPANITTNISNGGVGYFSGYCINKAETITP